jgi:hypothetical protein
VRAVSSTSWRAWRAPKSDQRSSKHRPGLRIFQGENRIFGGARLGPIGELPDFLRATAEWAAETWVAGTPDQHEIWTSALPFARMDNGDYPAVDIGAG